VDVLPRIMPGFPGYCQCAWAALRVPQRILWSLTDRTFSCAVFGSRRRPIGSPLRGVIMNQNFGSEKPKGVRTLDLIRISLDLQCATSLTGIQK
jgi:hypothetical protein